MNEEREYMTEKEILENYDVSGKDLEELLEMDIVTSKQVNGRQVFNLEEIKMHFWERGREIHHI